MTRRRLWLGILTAAAVAAVASYVAVGRRMEIGGGTSYQQPPLRIEAGQSAIWQLQIAAWGEGAPVQDQVGLVRMEYRLGDAQPWTSAAIEPGSPTTVQVGQSNRLQYLFRVIAPSDAAGTEVSTRFHIAMGSRLQTIEGTRAVPVVRSAAS